MPKCNAAEIEKFERARSSHVIEKPSRSAKAFSIVIFRVVQPSIHLDAEKKKEKKKKKKGFKHEISRKYKNSFVHFRILIAFYHRQNYYHSICVIRFHFAFHFK